MRGGLVKVQLISIVSKVVNGFIIMIKINVVGMALSGGISLKW